MESEKKDALIKDALVHLQNGTHEKCFEFLAKALASSESTEQFNDSFHAVLFALNTMITNNNWAGLTKINVMYRSEMIADLSFVDFFMCIHELAMFHETDDLKHKKAYRETWDRLPPRLQKILAGLVAEENTDC
jgi:hypothetical protein